MKQDPFEEKLRDQTMSPLPASWRDEILRQTRQAGQAGPAGVDPTRAASISARISTRLREWLWPHPVAWGGLAAAWLFILGLHTLTPPSHPLPLSAHADKPGPAQTEMAAVTHHTLRQQLLDLSMDTTSARAKPRPSVPAADRPRSCLASAHAMA